MVKYFKYGTSDVLECSCGCGMKLDNCFLERVDEARELAGVPFKVNSGARCLDYNRTVGSKDTSTHVIGKAMDIAYEDELDVARIVHALSRVGFTRIGLNSDKKFIHVDKDPEKPDVVFGY